MGETTEKGKCPVLFFYYFVCLRKFCQFYVSTIALWIFLFFLLLLQLHWGFLQFYRQKNYITIQFGYLFCIFSPLFVIPGILFVHKNFQIWIFLSLNFDSEFFFSSSFLPFFPNKFCFFQLLNKFLYFILKFNF